VQAAALPASGGLTHDSQHCKQVVQSAMPLGRDPTLGVDEEMVHIAAATGPGRVPARLEEMAERATDCAVSSLAIEGGTESRIIAI
jgi:hypothetical protein